MASSVLGITILSVRTVYTSTNNINECGWISTSDDIEQWLGITLSLRRLLIDRMGDDSKQ